ncbi:class I SAM-dependent RNA methyltransferase [Acidobacteriota bacterium]
MKRSKHSIDKVFEITLKDHAYGGDALGRLPDGRAVFVPFVLPGEKAKIHLTEKKKDFARGRVLDVIEPSPARVKPRCPHFMKCGGCHYQHLSYDGQLAAKAAILKHQLERLGRFETPDVRPAVPSPHPWNYRNHVQFHLSPDGRLGFNAHRSHRVVPIKECHLPDRAISNLWPRVEPIPHRGIKRLGFRSATRGAPLVVVEGDAQACPDRFSALGIQLAQHRQEEAAILEGEGWTEEKVLDRLFRVSALSFFQVNTPMAGAMVEHILNHLEIDPGAAILELYCGVGLFSAFLAPRAARLIGIESSLSACRDFVFNLREFDNVELRQGSVEDILPDFKEKPDLILADPPRSGMGKEVLGHVLKLEPKQLIYVSCDPATLARDARILTSAGYRLEHSTPLDLFPQTYHIESISFFGLMGSPRHPRHSWP